jgi:hypothetical protein
VDVPVQFFQSVIAIELAVTGALLWHRFFESKDARRREMSVSPTLACGLALPSSWAQPCSRRCGRSQTKGQDGRRSPSPLGSPYRSSRSCFACCHRWRGTRRQTSAIPTTPSASSGWFSTLPWSPAFSSCSTWSNGRAVLVRFGHDRRQAQGRRSQYDGRPIREGSWPAYASSGSGVSFSALAPYRAASSETG